MTKLTPEQQKIVEDLKLALMRLGYVVLPLNVCNKLEGNREVPRSIQESYKLRGLSEALDRDTKLTLLAELIKPLEQLITFETKPVFSLGAGEAIRTTGRCVFIRIEDFEKAIFGDANVKGA